LQPVSQRRATSITLDSRAFSYWDMATQSWLIAPGCDAVMVGSSSRSFAPRGVLAQRAAACGRVTR
jgi:hypothetical protein